jgi:uroporphyrinogen decarboxylase
MEITLADPGKCDFREIKDAIAGTGEKGIVTAFVGKLFFDYIASAIEGGSTQAIYIFTDQADYLIDLQQRYIKFMEEMAEAVILNTKPDAIFIENGYSSIGIINPDMYRQWDIPVIKAVSQIARKYNVLLHVHQHGPCYPILNDLINAGVNLVDPLERPSSGDIHDLAAVKKQYGKKLALRGNMHSHEVLLRGTPSEVEAQVKECIAGAGERGGYILATGDGTIIGTPFKNIEAMISAGRKYGHYPLQF